MEIYSIFNRWSLRPMSVISDVIVSLLRWTVLTRACLHLAPPAGWLHQLRHHPDVSPRTPFSRLLLPRCPSGLVDQLQNYSCLLLQWLPAPVRSSARTRAHRLLFSAILLTLIACPAKPAHHLMNCERLYQ